MTCESSSGSVTPMMRSANIEGTFTGFSSVPKGAFTQASSNRDAPCRTPGGQSAQPAGPIR
eukprot:scaffold497_cov368-Prasinococcus_capsulatus_cf.AAC.23